MGVKPDFVVRIENTIEGRTEPLDIGVAYKNARGSITICLNALPLDKKLSLIPCEDGE